ncbi:Mannose-1-phosphate guanyltransferase alpha, partial [Thalictrum thalictroides]
YNKGFGDLGLNLFEMDSSEEKVVAVIMVGGPTKGTRFRPLSLNVPKPLLISMNMNIPSTSNELRVPVRYLKEDRPYGSAGGLYKFGDLIMEDTSHRRYGGMGTILVIKVSAESANQFGELVADPVTHELLHYTEKPETFVSDLINCGVYIFTPDIFTAIEDLSTQRKDRGW